MEQEFVYCVSTSVGSVWIVLGLDRHWHVIWDGEAFGSYPGPREAAAGISSSAEVDGIFGSNRAVRLPRDLSGWTAVARDSRQL